MDIHKNARLTPHGRERMVRMVLGGQTPQAVCGWRNGFPVPQLHQHFLATFPAVGRLTATEIFDPTAPTTMEPIMNRQFVTAVFAAAAAVVAVPTLVTPARAQIEVQIGTPQPQRNGAWGDRDRDGIPNAYDQRNDNRQQYREQAWGDRDRDGVPNRYDKDRDGDGVPNRWDNKPSNPNWR